MRPSSSLSVVATVAVVPFAIVVMAVAHGAARALLLLRIVRAALLCYAAILFRTAVRGLPLFITTLFITTLFITALFITAHLSAVRGIATLFISTLFGTLFCGATLVIAAHFSAIGRA